VAFKWDKQWLDNGYEFSLISEFEGGVHTDKQWQ
jgi:hypothetical protein